MVFISPRRLLYPEFSEIENKSRRPLLIFCLLLCIRESIRFRVNHRGEIPLFAPELSVRHITVKYQTCSK